MKPAIASALLCLLVSTAALGQERTQDEVVRAAVSPLPADLQSAAGVMTETQRAGEVVRVRESENGISCLLRTPSDSEDPFLDARCYSDLFWPAVLHNWALDLPSYAETTERMHADIEAGVVPLPDHPTAGYRVLGPLAEFDFESGELGPTLQKWQSVHFPFATSTELGITEQREGSKDQLTGLMPFVMASGTWWSHVMFMHEPWPWR
jgi:hypothetical protein